MPGCGIDGHFAPGCGPTLAQLGDQLLIPGVKPEPPAPRAAALYEFPRYPKCPRCGSLQTKRRGQCGDTQYRVCEEPICVKKFHVTGKLVAPATPTRCTPK